MSNRRSNRVTERFDYKIYSETGRKFLKGVRENLIAMANSDEEMKIVCKISRFMEEYELSLLYAIEDIEEGIKILHNIIESYEGIHIALKRELEEETYFETYPNYNTQIKVMTDWIKDAKIEIRKRNKEEVSDKLKLEKNEQIKKSKDKLRTEEKYFRGRIKQEIENMYDESGAFIEELENNISLAQELIKGYSDIFAKIEQLGHEFRDEFGSLYEERCYTLHSLIRNTKKRVQDIKLTIKKAEEVDLCNNIYDNICERFLNLERKCDVKIGDLTDSELLENKRDIKTIDSDFNDVLDRITKLSEANPAEFEQTSDLVGKIDARKGELKISMDLFKTNLENEISLRDLSEEKMKNASILGIKLPRFEGYDSSMDFYTFKAEFEKLVSPRVQAKLLPDYLKNNYLAGQALEIVKEITDLNEIWARLKLSFGSVVTLLANKLREIENGRPLWKIQSEEKLVQAIIRVRNCMMELSCLA